MPKKPSTPKTVLLGRWYRGKDIPMPVIRRYARQVAERFGPEKIILFGSHAYGRPHADSDVDLLIVMPARNEIDLSIRIRWAVPAPFPMDLLVRTPENLKWRLEEGDWFLREVVSQGKILYEKNDQRVDAQGRGRRRNGKNAGRSQESVSCAFDQSNRSSTLARRASEGCRSPTLAR
jgi:predicted nucleotidyltransferase